MPKLKALAISLASIVVLLAMTACGGLTPARPWPQLTVMTYNVYVGAPPDELLKVMSPADAPPKVAEFYRNYLASDFPVRAAAIAKIIKRTEPDIIGLQEISLVRKQDPSDAQTAPGPNATDVEQNFLDVFMMKLKDEGLDYKEAGKVETFDLEMPMPTGAEGLVDIRLTDHDVILVRSDIAVSNVTTAKYKTELPVETTGTQVPRGYVAVDATVGGVKYHVVNTHLEHFVPVRARRSNSRTDSQPEGPEAAGDPDGRLQYEGSRRRGVQGHNGGRIYRHVASRFRPRVHLLPGRQPQEPDERIGNGRRRRADRPDLHQGGVTAAVRYHHHVYRGRQGG